MDRLEQRVPVKVIELGQADGGVFGGNLAIHRVEDRSVQGWKRGRATQTGERLVQVAAAYLVGNELKPGVLLTGTPWGQPSGLSTATPLEVLCSDAVTLADVTRDAVLTAVAEFDRLGRAEFLQRYGFGEAVAYFLDYDGSLYDSKAIVGYAHGISGDRPWRAPDFTGGDKSVADRLRALGFAVRYLRSPNWTRDEIIVACALVESNGWRTVPQEDQRAIDLSRLLQSPAIHPLDTRRSDFRNPAGIERKTSDLVTRHPNHRGKLTNGNHLDVEVVRDFLERPAEMRRQAEAIRDVLSRWEAAPPTIADVEEITAEEGGVLLKEHLRRERDPALKAKKIAEAKRCGVSIACEACGFDFYRVYGERGRDYIECHHRTPLNVSGPIRTRLQDLALVCSNCHRMIHRRAQWLTVEDLQTLVATHGVEPKQVRLMGPEPVRTNIAGLHQTLALPGGPTH